MRRWLLVICGGLLCGAVAVTIGQLPSLHQSINSFATVTAARVTSPVITPFPVVNTIRYTPSQKNLIILAKIEFAKHPTSFDSSVLRYTDGNKEAWCADFASWMMRQLGNPYLNPNSGSWRIPGVFTLQDYYRSRGKYVSAGNYTPRAGDVAFVHIGEKNLAGDPEGHVEIVLSVSGDTMTTIGGNEGGKMRIDTQSVKAGVNGLDGFGIFGT